VPKFTLSKNEKLKSRKAIDRLFSEGKTTSVYPIKQVFIIQELEEGQKPSLFAVSVPKRNFKKAVDRNRIKRLIREAYRLNCLDLKKKLTAEKKQMQVMYIFIGREIPEYSEVEKKMISLLERTVRRI
jgi:ribonuclease P protein component